MLDELVPGAAISAEESPNPQIENDNPGLPEEAQDIQSPEAGGENEKREKHKPGGFQRKVIRLQREKAELESRLAAYERTKQASVEIEPSLDDYATYADYNRALVRYHTAQVIKQRDNEHKQIQESKRQQQLDQEWQGKIDNLDAAYSDYEDVVGAYQHKQVPAHTLEALREAGPEVVYHLAKDTELADKIEYLSPLQLAREILKIETRLASSNKPAAKVSKLPPPITPLKSSASAVPDLAAMDFDSFYNHRYPSKRR